MSLYVIDCKCQMSMVTQQNLTTRVIEGEFDCKWVKYVKCPRILT